MVETLFSSQSPWFGLGCWKKINRNYILYNNNNNNNNNSNNNKTQKKTTLHLQLQSPSAISEIYNLF